MIIYLERNQPILRRKVLFLKRRPLEGNLGFRAGGTQAAPCRDGPDTDAIRRNDFVPVP
jgi:hypothetical protein